MTQICFDLRSASSSEELLRGGGLTWDCFDCHTWFSTHFSFFPHSSFFLATLANSKKEKERNIDKICCTCSCGRQGEATRRTRAEAEEEAEEAEEMDAFVAYAEFVTSLWKERAKEGARARESVCVWVRGRERASAHLQAKGRGSCQGGGGVIR